MTVYKVKADSHEPVIIEHIDMVADEVFIHLDNGVKNIEITAVEMSQEEFDALEEHRGY